MNPETPQLCPTCETYRSGSVLTNDSKHVIRGKHLKFMEGPKDELGQISKAVEQYPDIALEFANRAKRQSEEHLSKMIKLKSEIHQASPKSITCPNCLNSADDYNDSHDKAHEMADYVIDRLTNHYIPKLDSAISAINSQDFESAKDKLSSVVNGFAQDTSATQGILSD